MRFWQCNIFVFFVLFTSVLEAQTAHLALQKSVKHSASILEIDNIGQVYTIKEGKISKFSSSLEFVMKNSAMTFGQITSMDATNALKMILFFKDLSQVIYLDNQLSVRGDRVELDVLGYFQTTAVCRSYNDGFWVYDQTTFELTRFTEQLEISQQSGNLAQVLDFVPNPNYMRESSNWLYVNDPEQGVLVFDWYGSYTKTIPVKGVKKFVLRAEKLFYLTDKYLESYDLRTSQFAQIELPKVEIVDFSLFEDNLVIITQNELQVYRIIVE